MQVAYIKSLTFMFIFYPLRYLFSVAAIEAKVVLVIAMEYCKSFMIQYLFIVVCVHGFALYYK
jgi:hypothetical protein